MKGKNVLIINAATMKEALQYWLEMKVFKSSDFEVSSVLETSLPTGIQYQIGIISKERKKEEEER